MEKECGLPRGRGGNEEGVESTNTTNNTSRIGIGVVDETKRKKGRKNNEHLLGITRFLLLMSVVGLGGGGQEGGEGEVE